MERSKENKELTQKEKIFCSEYIFDWNATRSYKVAYPNVKNDNTAGVNAYNLLRNPKIKEYITNIQEDIEKQAGISRLKVIKEHEKIAFNSIAHLHDTWIKRKDFNELNDDQKDCISEISTQIKNVKDSNDELFEIEYVKVKLFDKQKALDSISKMLGYNEAEKHNITANLGIDEKKTIKLEHLTSEEQELLKSINVKQLKESSGVSSK